MFEFLISLVVMIIWLLLFVIRVIILEDGWIFVVVGLFEVNLIKLLYWVKLLIIWVDLFFIFILVNGDVVVFVILFSVVLIFLKLNWIIVIVFRIVEDNVRFIFVERLWVNFVCNDVILFKLFFLMEKRLCGVGLNLKLFLICWVFVKVNEVLVEVEMFMVCLFVKLRRILSKICW